jgi:hypothetical protein
MLAQGFYVMKAVMYSLEHKSSQTFGNVSEYNKSGSLLVVF